MKRSLQINAVLLSLFVGAFALASDSYTAQENLSDLDVETQFEDVQVEQLRFQKKTLKADEKRLAKESRRIEIKLKTVQKRNQQLEKDVAILSEKVQKMQTRLDERSTKLLVARDKHEYLAAKKSQLLKKIAAKSQPVRQKLNLKPTQARTERTSLRL